MTKEEWKKIRGSSEEPDQIMLSIKGDASRGMTVRWRNDVSVTQGFALYRPAGSDREWTRAVATVNTFETDVDVSNFFFADMTGLEPDTVYEYTVGSYDRRSRAFSFRTARENPESFSFLCLSDIQTGGPNPPADYTEFNCILKRILAAHPEIEFIMTAGDNTNCGQTDVQWTGMLEGFKGVSERLPVMLCMGNHDDMGFEDYFTFRGKYYSEYATYFTNQLKYSYAANGPEKWEVPNYSFDYGSAHFAMTGTSGYDAINAWLCRDMGSTDKKWRIAAHHFPVCFSGPEIEIEDTYPALRDAFDMCDVVFSGHEHSFARSYPRRSEGLFDRPSEGTVHYNLGSGNRNPPGTRVVPKVWNARTYEHEEDISMYTVATVDGGRLRLTAYVEGGRVIDDCVIDKDSDCITPVSTAPVYNKMRLKFKGYDPGMCNRRTLPQKIGDIYYISPGQLISFIGGDVVRTPGKIRLSVYGRFAEFTENSDVMLTDGGEIKMSAPCLRLNEGQLFVPVADFCAPLRMRYFIYEHNNFISIESETEAVPIPVQP